MPVQVAAHNDPRAKQILYGYYAAFTLLLVSFLLTFYTNSKLNSHMEGVDRTNKIVRILQTLFAEVKNAESSFQGFLIIQDEIYLDPYRGSYLRADSIAKELHNTIQSDPRANRIDSISRLLTERYALFESGLKLFNNYEVSDSIVKELRKGKMVTNQLTRQLYEMELTEKAALAGSAKKLKMYSNAILPVNLFTFLLAIVRAAYSFLTYSEEKRAAITANEKRKEKEAQLVEKVNELKIANEELVKFRRMEKFAATGRMARIIAHEVRNPLSNIYLAVTQLKDEPLANDENSSTLLDMVARNSERINQLVTDLLNATRIQEMNFSSVSVNTLLDEALAAAADRAQLKHIKVIKEYSPDLCNISADKEKLKIAFLNIIVNAIEAMKAGSGVLRLKTEQKNGKCVVSISDNGVGIDKESLSKLFEPYFTSKPKGSGLGLANTQAIILTHKGNIEVDSEPGKGTTFSVTLDFAE